MNDDSPTLTRSPPLPIFIISLIDYTKCCGQLKLITGDEEFICKSTLKNLKVSLQFLSINNPTTQR